MNIKKGDKVKILRGKDSLKEGKILKILTQENKVVIEGLNMRVKHMRPKRQGEKGTKLNIPTPIDRSKVMLICPKCSKPTRIGHSVEGDKKVRICKKCKASID